jgi:lysozyme family protein
VNHGTGDAIRWLQRALKVAPDDGALGPRTLAAIEVADVRRIYLSVCAQRVRRYGDLITRQPSQAIFASGWATTSTGSRQWKRGWERGRRVDSGVRHRTGPPPAGVPDA